MVTYSNRFGERPRTLELHLQPTAKAMPTAAVGAATAASASAAGGASGVEGDDDGDALPAGEVVSRELIEGAREAARKDERSRVRAMLHTEAPLKDAAENAVRDLLRLLATPPAEGDASAPVADASGLEAISEELVKERLVSASLQAMIDQHEEQVRLKIAAERRACQLLLARNDPSEVESAWRRSWRRRGGATRRSRRRPAAARRDPLPQGAQRPTPQRGRPAAAHDGPRAHQLAARARPAAARLLLRAQGRARHRRPRGHVAASKERGVDAATAVRVAADGADGTGRALRWPPEPAAAVGPRALLGIALGGGTRHWRAEPREDCAEERPAVGRRDRDGRELEEAAGAELPAAAAAASARSASSTYRERWNTK